ncbi:MAG: NAD-dependent epimerase/dehydratase family protein [Bryobacteraceae bacterium]
MARVLVIGGTLFIGRQLVKQLLKAGHAVTVLHRRDRHSLGKKVDNVRADRNDAAAMRAALVGRKFDAVYDNVYAWETGTTAAQVMATAQLFEGQISRYVFMSSVAAYGDGLNHQEGDPLAPDTHEDAYVRNKAMSERALFRFHAKTRFPVVTLRPPFVYGPGEPFYREQFFWDRMKLGRPILVPGDGRRLMQFVYVNDLVDAAVAALDAPAAAGEAFNVANPKPISQIELVQALAAAAKKTPQLVAVPRRRLVHAGGHPMREPYYFAQYFDLTPITEFVGKAQRLLGFKPTPFADGLKETYRWYVREHKMPKIDFAYENAMLLSAGVTPPASKKARKTQRG